MQQHEMGFRTLGDRFHAGCFDYYPREAIRALNRGISPPMEAGWKRKIAWCREEVRLLKQLEDAGLTSCEIRTSILKARKAFYADHQG